MPEPTRYPLYSIPRKELEVLFTVLSAEGYCLVGPTLSDGVIVYDHITKPADLPTGWTDRQEPGSYRLEKRADQRAFGFVVGPHSWKKFLFPARETLQPAVFDEAENVWRQSDTTATPMAFIGVRACELAAMDIQDRVFIDGRYTDESYASRRKASFIVAVNCLEAGDLCFCDSMNTGPEVKTGFDICLTELDESFLIQAGTEQGNAIVTQLKTAPISEAEDSRRVAGLTQCRQQMGRRLDTDNIEGILFANLDNPRWDKVAECCLACGNCTMVCPTCFCYSVDEVADLGEDPPQRERSWDSCFSQQHSQISGATFQPAIKDRYRQWLTHKLGSWTSQFGTSGCVGCGRCIAWCPVGIDITEEVTAIQASAKPPIPDPIPEAKDFVSTREPFATLFSSVDVTVAEVITESSGVVTLRLKMPKGYQFRVGQFNMLSLPGIGEIPISVSGECDGCVEHTVHNVGKVSAALCALEPGNAVGFRGPYGSCWPDLAPSDKEGSYPITLIAGGIGLAPLRGVIRHLARQKRDQKRQWVRLIYGARKPEALLFSDELSQWRRDPAIKVAVTVDHSAEGWTGNVGTVTTLLRRKEMPLNGKYLICGPEVMMLAVVRLLREFEVPSQHIFLSLERNMKCAAGHCGRCQYGPYFICKDGPVFSYDRLEFLFGQRGF